MLEVDYTVMSRRTSYVIIRKATCNSRSRAYGCNILTDSICHHTKSDRKQWSVVGCGSIRLSGEVRQLNPLFFKYFLVILNRIRATNTPARFRKTFHNSANGRTQLLITVHITYLVTQKNAGNMCTTRIWSVIRDYLRSDTVPRIVFR